MNERVYEVLYFLLTNKERVVSMEILCKKFAISIRTVKSYLAVIEDYVDSKMKGLLLLEGDNIRYNGTAEQAAHILNKALKEDFYEYKLSPKERRFIIGMWFLQADEPVTLAQLNDLLFTSRATLIKDVADVTEYFHDNNLEFYENKHKGFLLKLTESQRRDAVLTLVKDQSIPIMELFDKKYFNICSKFLRQKINIDIYWNGAEAALTLAEQHFKFSLVDSEFYEIVFMLCISAARLTDGRNIEDTFAPAADVDEICIKIAENILKNICQTNACVSRDILYLAGKLKGHNLIHSESAANEKLINFYIIIKSFLYRLSLAYGLNFLNDYKLQDFLTAHITGLYRRRQRGEKVKSPDDRQILEKYEHDFRILNDNIYIIEEYMGIDLTDDEKYFIFIHILAALERTKRKAVLPNVIIVCDSGIGTSAFLAEMVEKHFKVNITGVLPFHSLKKELSDDPQGLSRRCDFILSTIPLSDVPIPWLQVSVMLALDELGKIHNLIIDVMDKKELDMDAEPLMVLQKQPEKKKSAAVDRPIGDILSAGDILLDKQAGDWQEAIAIAAEPLVRAGKCTENYVQCMIHNVIQHGPYIVFAPGVAIAHAHSRDGACAFGVSILRLSVPVKFGHKDNDPVDIIVALSVDDANKQKEMLFRLMNVFCHKTALNELRAAQTDEQVKAVLERF